jgi:hypothetical protein
VGVGVGVSVIFIGMLSSASAGNTRPKTKKAIRNPITSTVASFPIVSIENLRLLKMAVRSYWNPGLPWIPQAAALADC